MKTKKILKFGRGMLSVLLAGVTALNLSAVALAGTVTDIPEGVTCSYTSDDGAYTFNKISHPDKDVQTADGIVDYIGNGTDTEYDEGQGDRGQNYSWAAIGYGDWMYIGTCYSSMGSVLGDSFDKETMAATLDTIYNGTFFNGQEDGGTSGGILVKVNTRTYEVKIIMSKTLNGYNALLRNAVEYNGKLYFCGSVNTLPSIYEIDPENDDAIACVHQGMTLREYYMTYTQGICSGIRGMCVYDGKLVVSCVGVNGPYIMITENPSEGFTTIATQEDLFGYPAYHYWDSIYGGSIWDMVSYNGSLYVSICTGTPDNMPDEYTMQSFAIVRGDPQEDGTFRWTAVVGDQEKDGAKYCFGIDPERTRAGAANLVVFNGKLYIAEYNDEEIALENVLFDKDGGSIGADFEFINRNLEQSVSLYAMDENENIELVVGDATEMFPDGSISGLGSGFGRNENQYIWKMQVYDGKLYLGTFDTSSLLEPLGQFSNGDLMNMTREEWISEISYQVVLLELLAEKNGYTLPSTSEEASALISKVIDKCNQTEAFITGLFDGTTKITLTAAQLEKLSELLLSGSIAMSTIGSEVYAKLSSIVAGLSQLVEEIESNDFSAFTEKYEELYEKYTEIKSSLTEKYTAFVTELETIFSEKTLTKLQNIVICMDYLADADRGFDLYVTSDGVNFETITNDGFGDPYNHGLRVFAVTNQGLNIGTANPFYGTQVWQLAKEYDIAGLIPQITYSSEAGDYTLYKLTHPDKDVKTADGIVDYIGNGTDTEYDEGQGDRGQNYSWASVGYGDWMYIGTCYSSMGNTLTLMGSVLGDSFDKETMAATLNSIYNGTFFNGQEDDGTSGGILVKLNTKTCEVKIIMSKTLNGYNAMLRNAVEYNGKLYFCGSVNGLPSIYQIDPENEDAITCVHQGMTMAEYYMTYKQGICSGIRGMCVYDDKLVVSCVGVNGPYIMISDNPENGFTTIATQEDLFGYPAYHYWDSIYGGSIWDMISYNGSLYVSLCTGTPDNMPDEYTMQSFAIVRGDPQEDGTFKWPAVVGDQEKDGAKYCFGIDPERTRAGAANLVVFNGKLYIAENNDEEIALENVMFDKDDGGLGMDLEFMNRNLEQSVSLYAMDENENIELVVGDATEMFPDGSTSGLGSGFGRNENQYIWKMEVYDGKLYLGTFDTSSLLEPFGQFSNGDLLNMTEEEWRSQIGYNIVLLKLLATKNGYETPATVTEAMALIEQIVEKCNENIRTVSDWFGGIFGTAGLSLTEDQKTALSGYILDGSVRIGSLDEETAAKLEAMLKDAASLLADLGSKVSESFINKYEEIVAEYEAMASALEEKCAALAEILGDIFNEKNLNKFKSVLTCLSYMSKAERGFDLYVTEDGINFETITTDGLGDPYNHGLRVFAVTNQGLCIGTANPFYGTQVWLISESCDVIDLVRVLEKIDAIGVVEYTEKSKALIEDARSSYDALAPILKLQMTEEWYKVLTDAEARYLELKDDADTAAANEVIKKINLIGQVAYTDACYSRIEAARISYSALTDDQKAKVTEDWFNVLADAIENYAGLRAVSISYADRTQTTINTVIEKIRAIGNVEYNDLSKSLIDAARYAYTLLTRNQRALIPAEQLKVLTDAETKYTELKAASEKAAADAVAASAVAAKIGDIGTVEYTITSKALIDAARKAYNALDSDQKKLITESQLKVLTDAEEKYAELKAEADKVARNAAAAAAVVEKINGIGEVTYTDECKALIDDARAAYDALTEEQKALITEVQLAVLTDAESDYENLKLNASAESENQSLANKILSMVNAIGSVAYSEESKSLIVAARNAYDALTSEQKGMITPSQLKVLTDAEASYARLEAAVAEAKETEAVKVAEVADITPVTTTEAVSAVQQDTILFIAVVASSLVVIAVCLLVYRKKHRG